MRRSVYFHIDEVARDAVVAANLRQILKKHGIDLVYGNRAHSQLLGLFSNFSAFDLYFFPSLDLFRTHCPHPERLIAPVIILPSETVGGTTSNLERLAAKYFGTYSDSCAEWIEKVAAFCVWGPSHLKAFEIKDPSLLTRCHVVGHPRFDRRCQLSHPASRQPEKIRLGIISRFSVSNPFDRRGLLQVVYEGRKVPDRPQPIYSLSPERDVEDRFYTEVMDLRLILQFAEKLDPARFEITLRTHPREDRTSWEELIRRNKLPMKMALWDQPFLHWLNETDYVVGPVSTSFYDCIMAGRKPICTMDIVPRRENHILIGGDDENPILQYVIRPKSMAELVQIVGARPSFEKSELPAGLLDILRLEANYPDCSSSLDNVSSICVNVLERMQPDNHAKLAARFWHDTVAVTEFAYSQIRKRGITEQSSSFVLTRSRRRWIDHLAFSN